MEGKYVAIIVLVVIVYLCAGAAIFMHLEKPAEMSQREKIQKAIQSFKDDHPCIEQKSIHEFLQVMMKDITYSEKLLQGKPEVSSNWDFAASFCFVVTTVTTIGYGNLSPKTVAGRIVVILYALIGIPLTLIMLGHIGDKLKNVAQKISKLNLFSKKPHVNKTANMLIIIILGISVLFIAPAAVFHKVEYWTLLEAIYFCFITLSTIGFGDYIVGTSGDSSMNAAVTNVYRVATYIWVIIGLAYISLIISYLASLLAKKGEQVQKQVKKLECELDSKKNQPEMFLAPQDREWMKENGGVALVKFYPTLERKGGGQRLNNATS